MALQPQNVVRLSFNKPTNGIESEREWTAEWDAAAARKMRVADDVLTVQAANAVILRPDLTPIDMTGRYEQGSTTDYRGSWYRITGGIWERRNVFGAPQRKVEYQKEVEKERIPGNSNTIEPSYWRIDTIPTFGENQGFVVWFSKYLLPHGWDNCLVFSLMSDDETHGIRITIGRLYEQSRFSGLVGLVKDQQEVLVEYWRKAATEERYPSATVSADTQKRVFTLPRNIDIYQWSGDVVVLSLFIVDRFICIGLNGTDSLISFPVESYDEARDSYGRPYPIISPAGAKLSIWGYGAAYLGFKPMHYATEGVIETPISFPGYRLSTPEVAITRAIVPSGTSISWQGRSRGSESIFQDGVEVGPLSTTEEQEGVEATIRLKGDPITTRSVPPLTDEQIDELSEADREERRRILYERSVSPKTPTMYRWKIKNSGQRTSATPAPMIVEKGVIEVGYSLSATPDDEYSGGGCDATITCRSDPVDELFALKAPRVTITAVPRELSLTLKCGTYAIAGMTLEKSQFGVRRLKLEGRDVYEELRVASVGTADSFDDRGWTDLEMMKYLIEERAGLTLVSTAGDPTYTLSRSPDEKKPNWKWNAGAKVLDAIRSVREYSGKLVYPDREGRIVYKVRPTIATAVVVAEINALEDVVPRVQYATQDNWYTHMSVIGTASEDSGTLYKRGESLVGIGYNKALAREVGKTRIMPPVVYPQLGSWDDVKRALDALWWRHTTSGIFLSVELDRFEEYADDLWLYDVIRWTDPENSDLTGLYLVRGIDVRITRWKMGASLRCSKLEEP